MSLPRLLFVGFFSIFFLSTNAQDNTLVMGRMANLGLVKEIEIKVNEKYLNNNIVSYTAEIMDDGRFAFPLEINEAQLVSLTYSRNKTLIYLEPNDTLEIIADANSFPFSNEFGHRGGANNTHLKKYYEENPPELNAFKLKQYRSKGTYWYINTPDMDRLMLGNNPSEFSQKMALRKETAFANLDFFNKNNPSELTPEFRNFISTEILYDWAYHMLLYGDVFKNRFGITADFFSFLHEVPLQNEGIGNYWYRQFLQAYLCFRYAEETPANNAFAGQYDLSKKLFSGKPMAYLQSEMLVRGFRAKQIEALQRKYWDFTDNNTYSQLDDKVVAVYYQIMKYAEGSLAPDFTLADQNGQSISLHEYKGKVIYLNFWASWCRPCMAKIDQLKAIQTDLEQQGIVFLHVSLDRQKETWLETLRSKNIPGLHVLANGAIDSDIARNYQIKILPQYYIIDKLGNFATKPKEHDLLAIESILSRLNSNTSQ